MDFEELSNLNLSSTPKTKQFSFTGKASEFFGIWIVNILLTILTLGIYSAWAKVRTNQYFYGNTQLDGASFQYLATPMQILKSRSIAALLFVLYYALNSTFPLWGAGLAGLIFILIPAIIVMSMSFRMRHTAYRNVTFGFRRNFKQAYLVYSGPVLFFGAMMGFSIFTADIEEGAEVSEELAYMAISISIIMLVALLLFPVWEWWKSKFMVANIRYGASFFDFRAKPGGFYAIYIKAFFLSILVGAAAVAMTAGTSLFFVSNEENVVNPMVEMLAILLVFPFYLWFFAYIQTKRTNLIYSNADLEDAALNSDLSVNHMFYLYLTNTLAIIVSLGLLIPWAMIRTAKYRAQTLTLITDTDLDQFVSQQEEKMSAFGEEFGEVFDIEVGI